MESIERVYNAFKFKEVDRIPVIPQLTYASALWVNNTITECMNNAEKQYKALINAYKECKYDGIYAGWEGSFNLLASAMGANLKYTDENPPSVEIPPVSKIEDLKKFIEENEKSDNSFVNYKLINTNITLIKKLKSNVNNVPILSYIPGPFTYVGVISGLTKLMINVIRNPDFIKEAMELVYPFILRLGVLKIEAGIDCITIADPSSSSTIISPDNFRNFGLPFIKRLIEDLRKEGSSNLRVGVHICGNTSPIQKFIEELRPDYFEVDSLVPIAEARKNMVNTCLIGNIAPSDLSQKTASEIRELCINCLDDLDGKGHILSSGCEIAYGTPIENIKEMTNTVKDYKL
ncbi:MAG: uroporphyrinogen decarboxylase family protein [Candidatus Helarchaeota archaeon]